MMFQSTSATYHMLHLLFITRIFSMFSLYAKPCWNILPPTHCFARQCHALQYLTTNLLFELFNDCIKSLYLRQLLSCMSCYDGGDADDDGPGVCSSTAWTSGQTVQLRETITVVFHVSCSNTYITLINDQLIRVIDVQEYTFLSMRASS